MDVFKSKTHLDVNRSTRSVFKSKKDSIRFLYLAWFLVVIFGCKSSALNETNRITTFNPKEIILYQGDEECLKTSDDCVQYKVDCNTVMCPNADEASSYESDGYQKYTCKWNCKTYKGMKDRFVAISFETTKVDPGHSHYHACNKSWYVWRIASEYVDSGIACYE